MGASQFNLILVIAAIGVGGIVAWVSGKRVAMTDMPQMIALYNGMGGGAAAAIAAVELYSGGEHNLVHLTIAAVGGLIGAVSFSGSLIAFAKLQGLITKSVRFGGQKFVNLACCWCRSRARRDGRPGQARRACPSCRCFSPLRAGARRRHDAADRRRRHAGGDLALQRTDRPRGRLRGLRARQRRHDHRRHRGRRGRHAADPAHGEGHEPLARQRAVRELRRDLPAGGGTAVTAALRSRSRPPMPAS